MRILAKSGSFVGATTLGFFPKQLELFERFIHQSHGIILVTGPTGSGKSTTLFAALNEINESTRNINTVEDPVEYNVIGVNQMQVNPQIGVSFATGLRSLLRQDPDVIMVGEIRDHETAEIAVQAALTGHLVLSTLHTNSAAGAITRLLNMGIEPFLITSSLIGAIGQRLLRTICPNCKELRPTNRPHLATLTGIAAENIPAVLPVGRGCEKCSGRGMKGRTAVYEIMPMTDKIREMLARNAPVDEIHHRAVSDGMMTMRAAGLEKVLQGQVTPEEMMRVLYSEEF